MQPTRSLTLIISLLLSACVTINIYFPAAAAEKAADRIIRDVWGLPPAQNAPGAPASPAPAEDKTSLRQRMDQGARSVMTSLLQVATVTTVYAQEPDLTISSPAINKLTAAMEARHTRLQPYYQSGAIGLTANALVEVRAPQAIPLNERNVVKQLVADENNDRAALYREIAKANGHPEWEDNIRQTFAGRWIANASAGWWYQESGGAWKQK
ncbi:MAG: YdbL family protein [Candidatus Binatia bacterium]